MTRTLLNMTAVLNFFYGIEKSSFKNFTLNRYMGDSQIYEENLKSVVFVSDTGANSQNTSFQNQQLKYTHL